MPFQNRYLADKPVETEFLSGAAELIRRSAFHGGPYAASFEKAFGCYLGARHCLGLDSGASAFHLALEALGSGPGDEIIAPAFASAGSAWGILRCGATPVFADVDPETGCIDANSIAAAITPRTRAVIVAHLFGRPADLDLIEAVLDEHPIKGRRIALIEDASHAIGARRSGRAVGTWGDAGCFSFLPGGSLGAAGEAGAEIAKSGALAARIARLRGQGLKENDGPGAAGFEYRMDGLQGLFLEKKLAFLDRANAERSAQAAAYLEGLYSAEAVPLGGGEASAWHLFVCRVKRRKAFLAHLDRYGIGYGIPYPAALPEFPPFRAASALAIGKRKRPAASGQPHALALARSAVSLPLFCGMTLAQVERVCKVVNAFG